MKVQIGIFECTRIMGQDLVHPYTKNYRTLPYYKELPYFAMTKEFKNVTVSFDPSSFHPTSLQAIFASFVENEYMSGIDVLVTVGRGQYQDNIVKRFLKLQGP